MTIKLLFGGELKEVALEERYLQEGLVMKAIKVAATRAYGLCMEDYQLEVGGAIVVEPEDFEPEEVFEIVPKSDDIDVMGLVQTVVGTVVGFFSNAQKVLTSQAFRDEVMKIAHILLRVAKGAAMTSLKAALDSKFEELIQQANQVIEKLTGQKDTIPIATIRDFLTKMEVKLQ